MDALTGTVMNEATDCIICQDDPQEAHLKTTCGHTFCVDCARKWFTIGYECPACRTVLYDKTTTPPVWKQHLAAFDFQQNLQFRANRKTVEARIAEFAADPVPARYHSGRVRIHVNKLTNAALGAMIHLRAQAPYEAFYMTSEDHEWINEYQDIYVGVVHKIKAFLKVHSGAYYEANKLKTDLFQWTFATPKVEEPKVPRDPIDSVRFHLKDDADDDTPDDFNFLGAAPIDPEEQLREAEQDLLHDRAGSRVMSDVDRIINFVIEYGMKDQKPQKRF